MIPKGISDDLSPLEAEVMKVLVSSGQSKVRNIYDIVSRRRKVALTSVAVMLDRLHVKGFVKRKIETCRGGTRYLYSLKKSTDEIEEDYMRKQVDKLVNTFGDKAVAYFNERFKR